MQGIPEEVRREFGVNLTAGRVNCVEMTQKSMNAPALDVMLEAYLEHKAKKSQTVDFTGPALAKVG